jgi:hypothetical protein
MAFSANKLYMDMREEAAAKGPPLIRLLSQGRPWNAMSVMRAMKRLGIAAREGRANVE